MRLPGFKKATKQMELLLAIADYSEIILSAIDKILCDRGFVFRRYVDDYKFYFRSESQAEESIRIIEKILNQYNLNLN